MGKGLVWASINLQRWEGNPFTNMGWGLLGGWQVINSEGLIFYFFLSWIPPALLSVVFSNNLALKDLNGMTLILALFALYLLRSCNEDLGKQ